MILGGITQENFPGILAVTILGIVLPQVGLFKYVCGWSRLGARENFGLSLAACQVLSLLAIAFALQSWGAPEVRANPGTSLFLTGFGGWWMLGAALLFPWLGISLRDDAMERRNAAALVALLGGLFGVGLIYAGGSLGDGPDYSENFFSAGLGLLGLFGVWAILEIGGAISRSVAEERDLASGLRLAGFLVAQSLILARAVAGDWHSISDTVHDFVRDGWPALILAAVALLAERFLRPSRNKPFPPWPSHGVLPALFYLAGAAAWVWRLGKWEGFPG